MGMFTGIKEARLNMAGGEYIMPGKYWMRCTKTKIGETRKKEQFAAIELTVVKVLETVESAPDAKGEVKVISNRMGQQVQWFSMSTSDFFLGDAKAIVAACFEATPEEVTEEMAETLFTTPCLSGRVLAVRAFIKPAKVKKDGTMGKPFTRVEIDGVVPIPQVLEELDDDVIAKFFPNQVLEKMLAEDEKGA